MFLGIDWTQWLPALTAALIALTVLVGIRGLYQDHTKEGKLTRAGWGVVAAMVVLGFLTFLSGLLDQRITAEKERAEAAEREERFHRQMASLRGLETGMRVSLGKQERLFGVASRNLSTSEALQQQTQANTDRVLRRVFEESNRISTNRVSVAFHIACSQPDSRFPVFPQLSRLQFYVGQGTPGEIFVSSTQSNQIINFGTFNSFVGELGRYDNFPAWRNARVTMTIFGEFWPRTKFDDVMDQFRENGVQGRTSPALSRPIPTHCNITVRLSLNGRRVLNASGPIRRPPDSTHFAVDFEDLHVSAASLLVFPD